MRSPLTGVIFALELTHDINSMLPLLVASFLAHGFTVLTLRRSILTEKIARRGYHLSREYALDPLEILLVRDVMRTSVVALRNDQPLVRSGLDLHADTQRGQFLYPIVDAQGRLEGVTTRKQLAEGGVLVPQKPVTVYPDEPLRIVVYRMVENGVTRAPVVERGDRPKLVGMVSLEDLLHARTHVLTEERKRERVIRIKLPFGQLVER